ncbi:SCAN domain-containing protein 3 [Trichonephila clavipes]|nr:SCAN domain-containing protein 3 [Trichonephila clavipes]
MDKFLSRKRTFDDNKASTSAQTSIVPKIKSRKYSQEYLNFGFTITEVNGEEKPLCVICSKILAADSMKPNKLKRHFETLHAIEIVETMLGDNFAKELQSIPLSNDTVSCRIDDIAEDVEQQLLGKLRDKLFSIQLDEATDSNKDDHFIAYVRFWDEEENLPEAEKFRDGLFLMKLSYLVDIFEKLNILNLQLQASNVHMFDTSDKINAFCRKLELWSRNLKQKNLEMFENADKCVKTYKPEEQHGEIVESGTSPPNFEKSPIWRVFACCVLELQPYHNTQRRSAKFKMAEGKSLKNSILKFRN